MYSLRLTIAVVGGASPGMPGRMEPVVTFGKTHWEKMLRTTGISPRSPSGSCCATKVPAPPVISIWLPG